MKKQFLNDFMDTMKLGGKRAAFQIKEKSPELIFLLATGLLVKGIVEACKATPDYTQDYNEHKNAMDALEEDVEDGVITEKEYIAETAREGLGLSKDFMKKYGKSMVYVGAALAGYGISLKIVRTREGKWKSVATDMFLATMAYRRRVADEVGEQKEYDLFHNIKRELVEEEYEDEKGKKKKRTVEKPNYDEQVRGGHNSYWFGVGDPHYQGIKEFDLNYIIETEMMFNRILKGRGHGGKILKEELLRFTKWYDNDPFKLEANDWGWVYNEHGVYDMYVDPITGASTDLPRIIKLTCNRDFMDKDSDINETWVDLNCYPIRPILEQMQKDILGDREAARSGKYIATI